jgi:mono/diheme cytochrome c family protein
MIMITRATGALLAFLAISASAADFSGYSGQDLYMRFCASCHGASGEGDGPVAPAVAKTVPDLTRLVQRQGGEFRDERLREIIDGRAVVVAHGTRYMPVWGYEFWVEQGADVEAEDEVEAMVVRLTDYVRTLQR